MYIDVVLDEVIWMVNWLHYLNHEAIPHSSNTRHLFCTRNVLGQTVLPYEWCNGIHVTIVSLDRSQNDSRLTVILIKGKRVFHLSILSSVCSGNRYAYGRLS